MEGRCKSKADLFWLANVAKCVGMKPTIAKAGLKGVLVVFRGEVGFDYKTMMKDRREDMCNGWDLEVLIFGETLSKGGCGEVFAQVMRTNFFQKHVPRVQFAWEVFEFTVRLKYKIRSSLLPSREDIHHGKQLPSRNPRLRLHVLQED